MSSESVMRLKVRQMFTYAFADEFEEMDIYGDVTDREIPTFCGPVFLTEEGIQHYGNILDVTFTVGVDCFGYTAAFLECDEFEELTGEDAEKVECKLARLFWDAAGYCSDSNWCKWFVSGDDDLMDEPSVHSVC